MILQRAHARTALVLVQTFLADYLLHDAVTHQGIRCGGAAVAPAGAGQLNQVGSVGRVGRAALQAACSRSDFLSRAALVRQRGHGNLPTAAGFVQTKTVVHLEILEQHLVETGFSRHLDQGPHRHAFAKR